MVSLARPRKVLRRAFLLVAMGAAWALLPTAAPQAWAAEVVDSAPMTTTLVVLAVDAKEPVPVRTEFRQQPPTITVEFPKRRILGALPERSTIAKGVIQAITARYEKRSGPSSTRFIRSIQIGLNAPYAYRVRSEPGRVIVSIEHPASVRGTAVEVALKGEIILGGFATSDVSDRFRAMQAAMAQAMPTARTMPSSSRGPDLSETAQQQPAASGSMQASTGQVAAGGNAVEPQPTPLAPAAAAAPGPARSRRAALPAAGSAWLLGLIILGGVAGAGWMFQRRAGFRRAASFRAQGRLPSGVVLIDQLVWRAFERQGHQLVLEMELLNPPLGTLRVLAKEGSKAALLFVGHGPFFEKQTVERFIRAMRDAKVEQGFLVAAGSFTVPAQRLAKEHRIILIGREQLVELLSAGAGSEYFAKQLEQGHARLEEAKATLRQFAEELDALRRQRNEASWRLGEERATSAKLEAELGQLTQQLHRVEAEIQRREQEAALLRKQWEESQWYLGESRERVQHLEDQMAALQELAKRVEAAERAQGEAACDLGEERSRSENLAAQVAELQKRLEASVDEIRTWQETAARFKRDLALFQTLGERRGHTRVKPPHATVEWHNGESGSLESGSLRDLSSAGIGLEADRELPESLRIRVTIPDHETIESRARRKWQLAAGQSSRCHSGYRLVGVSASTRARLDQLIEEFRSTPAA